jgi:hypothetical protein
LPVRHALISDVPMGGLSNGGRRKPMIAALGER